MDKRAPLLSSLRTKWPSMDGYGSSGRDLKSRAARRAGSSPAPGTQRTDGWRTRVATWSPPSRKPRRADGPRRGFGHADGRSAVRLRIAEPGLVQLSLIPDGDRLAGNFARRDVALGRRGDKLAGGLAAGGLRLRRVTREPIDHDAGESRGGKREVQLLAHGASLSTFVLRRNLAQAPPPRKGGNSGGKTNIR